MSVGGRAEVTHDDHWIAKRGHDLVPQESAQGAHVSGVGWFAENDDHLTAHNSNGHGGVVVAERCGQERHGLWFWRLGHQVDDGKASQLGPRIDDDSRRKNATADQQHGKRSVGLSSFCQKRAQGLLLCVAPVNEGTGELARPLGAVRSGKGTHTTTRSTSSRVVVP